MSKIRTTLNDNLVFKISKQQARILKELLENTVCEAGKPNKKAFRKLQDLFNVIYFSEESSVKIDWEIKDKQLTIVLVDND